MGQELESKGLKKPDDSKPNIPLVTIACHEDLTASDLVGRYLLQGDSTVWMDGPLTRAFKTSFSLMMIIISNHTDMNVCF